MSIGSLTETAYGPIIDLMNGDLPHLVIVFGGDGLIFEDQKPFTLSLLTGPLKGWWTKTADKIIKGHIEPALKAGHVDISMRVNEEFHYLPSSPRTLMSI